MRRLPTPSPTPAASASSASLCSSITAFCCVRVSIADKLARSLRDTRGYAITLAFNQRVVGSIPTALTNASLLTVSGVTISAERAIAIMSDCKRRNRLSDPEFSSPSREAVRRIHGPPTDKA